MGILCVMGVVVFAALLFVDDKRRMGQLAKDSAAFSVWLRENDRLVLIAERASPEDREAAWAAVDEHLNAGWRNE
jgi:hypothetical protein